MGKAIKDVPVEMRPFFKEMEVAAYHHQYSEVFNDFLIMCINAFSFPGSRTEADRDQALKKYGEKELNGFRGMFRELIVIQNKMIIHDKAWYDPFGSIYEAITSSYKVSGMGQFFTPKTVVDFMTEIIISDDSGPFLTVAEPAAGSGRMVIAAHVKNPGCFFHATDLDAMCYRMTALNMALHNASGVVHHANALTLDWYDAYIIDRVKLEEGKYFPVIKPSTREEADTWWMGISEYCRIMKGQPRLEPREEEIMPPPVITSPVQEIKKRSKKDNPEQLSLF